MSKQIEALKYALAAMEEHVAGNGTEFFGPMAAAREALAEQPAQQQEPAPGLRCKIIENCKSCQHSVGRLSCSLAGRDFGSIERSSAPPEWCPLPLYTSQPQRKPLTDEQFLEMILRTGTVELVSATTFVGGAIQTQGKIGLLRSAKIIKEFVEAAHGIKENR